MFADRVLPRDGVLVAEEPDEQCPGDEAADVRPERNATLLPLRRGSTNPLKSCKANQSPIMTQAGTRMHLTEVAEEDERAHLAMREEHDVGAHHPGDRARGADQRGSSRSDRAESASAPAAMPQSR